MKPTKLKPSILLYLLIEPQFTEYLETIIKIIQNYLGSFGLGSIYIAVLVYSSFFYSGEQIT